MAHDQPLDAIASPAVELDHDVDGRTRSQWHCDQHFDTAQAKECFAPFRCFVDAIDHDLTIDDHSCRTDLDETKGVIAGGRRRHSASHASSKCFGANGRIRRTEVERAAGWLGQLSCSRSAPVIVHEEVDIESAVGANRWRGLVDDAALLNRDSITETFTERLGRWDSTVGRQL